MNLGFETFAQLINRILDKHPPTKVTEKRYLKKLLNNKYKNLNDKFFKQIIKTKSKQEKLSEHNLHKKYRNKITELLRIIKQTYYQKYFQENKKNS